MNDCQIWTATDPLNQPTLEFKLNRNSRLITGAIWRPSTIKTESLVCLGHGASGDRYQTPICSLAQQFTSAGHVVIALDGPDHGLRQQGSGGRDGFLADIARNECLEDMCQDWFDAIDSVQVELKFEAKRYAYFGLSMATFYGLGLLARSDKFQAAALGLWGINDALPRADEVMDAVAKITQPILFLAQLNDEFWPPKSYLDLFDALASSNKRLHANPGSHDSIPSDEVDQVVKFLNEQLSEPSKKRSITHIVEADQEVI